VNALGVWLDELEIFEAVTTRQVHEVEVDEGKENSHFID
jgi:hypothetical protein